MHQFKSFQTHIDAEDATLQRRWDLKQASKAQASLLQVPPPGEDGAERDEPTLSNEKMMEDHKEMEKAHERPDRRSGNLSRHRPFDDYHC